MVMILTESNQLAAFKQDQLTCQCFSCAFSFSQVVWSWFASGLQVSDDMFAVHAVSVAHFLGSRRCSKLVKNYIWSRICNVI